MDENYYKKYEPIFGAWKIKSKLGEGNFGAVFEIEREDFGTVYHSALKAITIPKTQAELESLFDDGMDATGATQYLEQFVEKIVGEFVLMSKLKGNSHIVSYEDHQVIRHKDGVGWDILIRMELLTPLMTHMKSTSVTKRDVIQLGIDMCRALELCQKYNIIHRDIKPENIFVADSGDFKLGDFGIAKEVEKTQSGLTKTGTQTYMAPEVYKGQPYGSSVDIYSLGIVLYRLLNHNRAPFMPNYPDTISYNDRERALIMRMGGHKFPMPSGVSDSRLAEIAMKACSFKPEDRYSSPTQMREDLEAILYTEGEGILMFPKGDTLDINSIEYVSNGKSPNATDAMGNEDTEVMGDDATEIMDDDSTEIIEKARKQFTPRKVSSKKKIAKMIILIVCVSLVAIGAAYGVKHIRTENEQYMVTAQSELNSPIEFKISGTVSKDDYKTIKRRLNCYGCKYYLDKKNNVIAMEKSDLGSDNQKILATIHMILGEGNISLSNSLNNSEYTLRNEDFESAYIDNNEDYAVLKCKISSAEKFASLINDVSENTEDKLITFFVDGNVRYSVNAADINEEMHFEVKGDYDGQKTQNVMTGNLITETYAAGNSLTANQLRLIMAIIPDGKLSKTYDAVIDEKYGIVLNEAVDEYPEDTVDEPVSEPEIPPIEVSEEPTVSNTENAEKAEEKPKAVKKSNSTQYTATQQKQPIQQQQEIQRQQEQPVQQSPVQQPIQQTPVEQEPIQKAPVQQPSTNEDVPEIFDPTFD